MTTDTVILSTAWIHQPSLGERPARTLLVGAASDCVAYMGSDDRLALVSLREKRTIWVGDRGLRQRGEGVPPHPGRGARLAAMRIRKAASGRDAGLLDGNRFMPLGGEWAAPDAPVDAPVRLS